jgi:hypothetical protein
VITRQADLTDFDRTRFVLNAKGKRIGAVWRLADDRYAACDLRGKLGEFIEIAEAETAVKDAGRK